MPIDRLIWLIRGGDASQSKRMAHDPSESLDARRRFFGAKRPEGILLMPAENDPPSLTRIALEFDSIDERGGYTLFSINR